MSDKPKCSVCGAEVEADADFCSACGNAIETSLGDLEYQDGLYKVVDIE